MRVRPIDIARKLNLSTSALRHYEAWGIVPPVERASNGYRIYTEEHMAYFECIRAMGPGFGIQLTSEVMRSIQKRDVDSALWLVTKAQANLQQEKSIAEKTLQVLESIEVDNADLNGKRRKMTIGEVSAETSIPGSAIRHWEHIGLIQLPRDNENGYRIFYRSHVRQLLLIRTLRTAYYPLEVIRRVIKELETDQVEEARAIARGSLENLNKKNREQLRGMHALYRLCGILNLLN